MKSAGVKAEKKLWTSMADSILKKLAKKAETAQTTPGTQTTPETRTTPGTQITPETRTAPETQITPETQAAPATTQPARIIQEVPTTTLTNISMLRMINKKSSRLTQWLLLSLYTILY
jgi:hypothetical protein